MYDLTGWQAVPCVIADVLRHSEMTRPFSSLTDPDGDFGEPVIYTEWGITLRDETDVAVLREYRWPANPARNCAHYIPKVLA